MRCLVQLLWSHSLTSDVPAAVCLPVFILSTHRCPDSCSSGKKYAWVLLAQSERLAVLTLLRVFFLGAACAAAEPYDRNA